MLSLQKLNPRITDAAISLFFWFGFRLIVYTGVVLASVSVFMFGLFGYSTYRYGLAITFDTSGFWILLMIVPGAISAACYVLAKRIRRYDKIRN